MNPNDEGKNICPVCLTTRTEPTAEDPGFVRYISFSIYPSICLSSHPSVLLSICLSVCLSFPEAINPNEEGQNICPVCLTTRTEPTAEDPEFVRYVCLSVCPSVRSFVRPSVCPSIHLFVCPSIHLSVNLTRSMNPNNEGQNICPVCLTTRTEPTAEDPGFVRYVCLSVCLSIRPSVHLTWIDEPKRWRKEYLSRVSYYKNGTDSWGPRICQVRLSVLPSIFPSVCQSVRSSV